jgi:ribonuclease HI
MFVLAEYETVFVNEEIMLLSIDRVLQLLAEGKNIQKIAELSHVRDEDVCNVIEKARRLLQNQEGDKSRKKIIFKKKSSPNFQENADIENKIPEEDSMKNIFEGAELAAMPLGSYLLIYTDGASSGNPGPAGIGIVIADRDDRVVGRVSSYIGENTNNFAEYTAVIRALEIAIYYKTKDLKIRTDSELLVKQIKGEYKVSSDTIRPLYEKVIRLKKKINSVRFEHIPRAQNEKADHLAKRAVSGRE